MACVEKLLFLVGLGSLDGTVELCIYLLGHFLEGLVEVLRPFVLVEVELGESHSFHIGLYLYAHLTAEDVDKLD